MKEQTSTTRPSRATSEAEIAEILSRLKPFRPLPGMTMYAVAAGASFIYAEINWKTPLKRGSLKVVLTPNTRDVTSLFTINDAACKATATFDCKSVGVQMLKAAGAFLAFNLPLGRYVKLSCSTAVYIPS